MGHELSSLSNGGGRDTEACNTERTKHLEHDPSTLHTIPLDCGGNHCSPAPHLDDAMPSVTDSASGVSSPRIASTEWIYSTQYTVLSKKDTNLHQRHEALVTSTSDMTSTTTLPSEAPAAASSPHQQHLQKRTQYSVNPQERQRRSHDASRFELQSLHSGVDFVVANEFFSRSSSSIGSYADLDSSSCSDSESSRNSRDDNDYCHSRGAYHRGGTTPMGLIELYRSGRPLGHHLSRDTLLERPAVRERNSLDEAPTPLWSAKSSRDKVVTSPMHVPPVGSGVDSRVDRLSAPTCSPGTGRDSSSSVTGEKGNSLAPLASSPARPLRWHKPLVRSVSQRDPNGGSISSSATHHSPDTAVSVLSSHEEGKCNTRGKQARKQKRNPEGAPTSTPLHRTSDSAAATRTSAATVGATRTPTDVKPPLAGIEVSTARASLRPLIKAEPSPLDGPAEEDRMITQLEWRHTAGGNLHSNTTPTLVKEKCLGGLGGEYGSFMGVPTSPAHSHQAPSKDSTDPCPITCGACPPPSSDPPLSKSTSTLSNYSGSFFRPTLRRINFEESCDGGGSSTSGTSGSGTGRHCRIARCHGRGRGDGDNGVPATNMWRFGDSRHHHHHHQQPRRTGSVGGVYNLSSDTSSDFFASTQQDEQDCMFYGSGDNPPTNNNKSSSSSSDADDDENYDNVESEGRSPSTVSVRETTHMITGDGGVMAHSFGSLFSDSRAGSLSLTSAPSEILWMADYANGGPKEVATMVVPRLQAIKKAYSGARDASPPHTSAGLRRDSNAYWQQITYTSPVCLSRSPSPGTNGQAPSVVLKSNEGAKPFSRTALPRLAADTPTEIQGRKVTPRRQESGDGHVAQPLCGAPTVVGAPHLDGHDHIRATGNVKICSSDHIINRSSSDVSVGSLDNSGDDCTSPDMSARRFGRPSREKSPAETALASPHPHPPPPARTVVTQTEKPGPPRRSGSKTITTQLSATESAAASVTTLKSHKNRRSTLLATTGALVSAQGSSSALKPTRADSKDIILRPDRTLLVHSHRCGGGDGDGDGSGTEGSTRSRPRSWMHSSGMHLISLSFSSDSLPVGRVRGSLVKAAAATHSNSIERGRRATVGGGGRGNRAQAHHHRHSRRAGSVLSAVSRSASPRMGEADGRRRRHLRCGLGSGGGEMSNVTGWDDPALDADSKAAPGNLTTLLQHSVSSSSSLLASSSRNTSATGGVGSGSVRALRRKAARVRDLSTSSSVDSEAVGLLHPHSTAPPPHQQRRDAGGSTAVTSPICRLPRVTTSSSSGTAKAASGSANGIKLMSLKPGTGVDMNSNDVSTSRTANTFRDSIANDYNAPPQLHSRTQQQHPRVVITAPHNRTANGCLHVRNLSSQPLWNPAAPMSARTTPASPRMHVSLTSHSASFWFASGAASDPPMPRRASGQEKLARRPSLATSIPGARSNGSGGDNGSGGGGTATAAPASAVALLAGTPRGTSTKRRRPTTQIFTPWSVDLNRFKALQEVQGGIEPA